MDPDGIERVLLDEAAISERVRGLAEEISERFQGEPVVALGVLKGAFVFLSDLIRALRVPVEVAFLKASSYGSSSYPGELSVEATERLDLAEKNVLIVEDIVDTGRSLKAIRAAVAATGPARLATVVLLDKKERREVDVDVEHVGFTVPDEFLVGYGLDYAERYRNLPFVGILSRSVYGKA
jgi:hypoxanthine phosphoribosyltransferase